MKAIPLLISDSFFTFSFLLFSMKLKIWSIAYLKKFSALFWNSGKFLTSYGSNEMHCLFT